MRFKFLGTRGTYPISKRSVKKYGGDTPCLQVRHDQERLILDAGTGILGINADRYVDLPHIHILLTHLHLDHIQGLAFFKPLFIPGKKVTIWGPAGHSETLRTRLNRYLSPPIFPVALRDIPCELTINELDNSEIQIGSFSIRSEFIIHRGPTLGYRIECGNKTLAYLPDHEPMISSPSLYDGDKWVSGFYLAQDANVLIHDTQYTEEEYATRNGFGHSSIQHTINFARRTHCKRVFMFHHDPEHNDKFLAGMLSTARDLAKEDLKVDLAKQGNSYTVDASY